MTIELALLYSECPEAVLNLKNTQEEAIKRLEQLCLNRTNVPEESQEGPYLPGQRFFFRYGAGVESF